MLTRMFNTLAILYNRSFFALYLICLVDLCRVHSKSTFYTVNLDLQNTLPRSIMHFSTTSAVAIVAASLAASGSAFKIDTFHGLKCEQSLQQGVDIWDNSCAGWPSGFESFRISHWGQSGQIGNFFNSIDCSNLLGRYHLLRGRVDAESTSQKLELNRCYNFNGKTCNSISSRKDKIF